MKKFSELLKDCQKTVDEIMPWDLIKLIDSESPPLIVDVREADEFSAMHITNALPVPRGLLETSCEYGFGETLPLLVEARNKAVVVVCRSGNRSLLAAQTMQLLGYNNVISLMTSLRGWNNYELDLFDDKNNKIDNDDADDFFTSVLTEAQMLPKH